MPKSAQNQASRVVKPADERQSEILDVAQRLFWEKGYDRTPISAIIKAIGIAKGTFYHHYTSKQDLLDAIARRLSDRALQIAMPALHDPNLSAPEKFRAIFGGIGAWKLDNKQMFLSLLRPIYAEENVALRMRLNQVSLRMFAPVVTRVIEQGMEEGAFTCTDADVVVRMMFTLATDLGELIARSLLDPDKGVGMDELARQIDAYNDGINRLLGAEPGTIELFALDAIRPWFKEDA